MSTDTRERTIGIWLIAIMALAIGALGSCGGSFQLVGLLVQDALVGVQEDLANAQPTTRGAELQREMNAELMEVASAWRIPAAIAQVGNVLVSLVLLVAGVLILRWHPKAPMIFMAAAILGIVIDLALGGLAVGQQLQTIPITERYMQQIAEIGADPATERMMGGVAKASGALGFCFTAGWLLIKLGAYIGGIVYLRREPVRRLFG